MARAFYHLAQLNIAKAKAHLDDPSMADFVARIAELNAVAERSPGFVWCLTDAEAAPDEPGLLFNLSVWKTPQSLFEYVYRSVHVEVFRDKQKWFPPPSAPGLAMWWIPAGHEPTPVEAMERLDHPRAVGDNSFACGFNAKEPPPPVPEIDETNQPAEQIYDRRIFRTKSNSEAGEAGGSTLFRYRQAGARVWATYGGGGVRFGTPVAIADRGNRLDMRYRHLSDDGGMREGRCVSIPRCKGDRLEVDEEWEWTAGASGCGRSTLEEA